MRTRNNVERVGHRSDGGGTWDGMKEGKSGRKRRIGLNGVDGGCGSSSEMENSGLSDKIRTLD